tara:strand:- start:63 stop:332 length:270 start_codon:yes stop_codon:yes gene_type:complete
MIAFIVLLIINLMILKSMDGAKGAKKAKGDWTVYGTMGCGWTRKQLDHMKAKGISHTFVDCDKGGCDGMDAFPTMKSPKGEKIVGFKEV